MTTFTVTTSNPGGPGSIRAEVNLAQNGDTINFDPAVTTIDLDATLVIAKSITIEGHQGGGEGSPGVIIGGGGGFFTDLQINAGANVALDGLTIQGGSATGARGATVGSGSANPGAPAAGGIFDGGILNLTNSVLRGNTATGGRGAYSEGTGVGGGAGGSAAGGVYVAAGAAFGVNSTDIFSGNTATGGGGYYGHRGDGPNPNGGVGGASQTSGTRGKGSYGGAGGVAGHNGYNGYAYTPPGSGTSNTGGGGGGGGGNAFADYGGLGLIGAVPVCYASGTFIRTALGDVAVEALRIGDLAVTALGTHRPIRWLGHRIIDCRRHPRPAEVMPIRIAAHAFGSNKPARDLYVSPGHAICVDVLGGTLISAGSLVNGKTIVQIDVAIVAYWHVEFDEHEIILAEGLPAESYLEMGNRNFFVENGNVALVAMPDGPVRTHADFCRPFYANGPLVEAVRARLAAKADVMQREQFKYYA